MTNIKIIPYFIDYANMPTRYQDKFIADFVENYGTGADTSKYERKFILR